MQLYKCRLNRFQCYSRYLVIHVERTAGKRPFGRPRHRRECNYEMDLQEVGWADMDWIHIAQERHKC